MIDLRLGQWQTALEGVTCDAMICDPPYSARTHSGHNGGTVRANAGWVRKDGRGIDPATVRSAITYDNLTPAGVAEFVEAWAPRVRGWWAVMSDHTLQRAWMNELGRVGLCTFIPIPVIIPGMTVRLGGDGPSSMAVWLTVARPRSREFAKWGTLTGYYIGTRKERQHIGGKPLDIMRAIIRDYSRPGDLVCDPFAGWGTTLVGAAMEGRRAVGSEMDPETHAYAMTRIGRGFTPDLFGGASA